MEFIIKFIIAVVIRIQYRIFYSKNQNLLHYSYNNYIQNLFAHLHFARSSGDLGNRCDCHKVQLEYVLPVSNEGWDANLQGGVDGGGCVCWPAMHTTHTISGRLPICKEGWMAVGVFAGPICA